MVLIDALPDDSTYWKERRDGDWSIEEYLRAGLVNEVRRLRADQAAIHANHKMNIDVVRSPAQERDNDDFLDRHTEVREHLFKQLHKTE